MKKILAAACLFILFSTSGMAIGLPRIGKWMIAPDMKPACWLNQLYEGKGLREPINVIIVDRLSTSEAEAEAALLSACKAAGYPDRYGHSTGYKGEMDGRLFSQFPQRNERAFSNRWFILNNNHGRIFGPYFKGGRYYFIAAFSREIVDWLKIKEIHQFGSFSQARDDFSWNMDRKTSYKVKGFLDLDNAIVGDPKVGTGDHDGLAVILGN